MKVSLRSTVWLSFVDRLLVDLDVCRRDTYCERLFCFLVVCLSSLTMGWRWRFEAGTVLLGRVLLDFRFD